MPIPGTMILGGPQNQAEGARNFAFDFETKDLRILIGQTTVVAVNLTIYAKVWNENFGKLNQVRLSHRIRVAVRNLCFGK